MKGGNYHPYRKGVSPLSHHFRSAKGREKKEAPVGTCGQETTCLFMIKSCWYTLCGRDSTRFDSVRVDSVRSGSSPASRHSSAVRPRVQHANHGAPQAHSRFHITMTSSL
ncbi:hypothetical protein Hanom_Chr07g00604401 [Helianthus anomalus]